MCCGVTWSQNRSIRRSSFPRNGLLSGTLVPVERRVLFAFCLPSFVLVCLILPGCLGSSYPSQSRPVCSWTNQPPPNPGAVCRRIFSTLRSIAAAETAGNDAAIHRLVPNSSVAQRIIRHGRVVRGQGVTGYHVVPSFTLKRFPGYIGAGFYLVGQTKKSKISDQVTLYLKLERGTAIVIRDQPAQDW